MALALEEISYIVEHEQEKLSQDPKIWEQIYHDLKTHYTLSYVQRPGAFAEEQSRPNKFFEILKKAIQKFSSAQNTNQNHEKNLYKNRYQKIAVKSANTLLRSKALQNYAMYNQDWLLDKIKAVGYNLEKGGHCFGIAHMAMQAFLANDLDTFNARLETIKNTDISLFRDNFDGLRAEQKSQTESGVIEVAAHTQQSITDLHAFFDGIVLYQDTKNFQYLFEQPETVALQDAAHTLDIVKPSQKQQPSLINTHTGA